MSLDQKFISIQSRIYDLVAAFFQRIAFIFGYPKNPGMPTNYKMSDHLSTQSQVFSFTSLPKHQTYWPPIQRPETWFEMFFGQHQKLMELIDIFMKIKRKVSITFILKIIKISIFYQSGSLNLFRCG